MLSTAALDRQWQSATIDTTDDKDKKFDMY
jgi:hypothetical protein